MRFFKAAGRYYTKDVPALGHSDSPEGISAEWIISAVNPQNRIVVNRSAYWANPQMQVQLSDHVEQVIPFASIQTIELCTCKGKKEATGICITEQTGGKHILDVKSEKDAYLYIMQLHMLTGK